jgi:DNA-directed RNA polymerase subunit F
MQKVIEMKPIFMQEVKEVLKSRKAASDKELNYEQETTFKYIEKFAKLTEKQSKDLYDSLSEISFLKDNEELKYQIINVIPTRVEQLQLILPKSITPSEDELKQVIELTKKFEDKIQ